MFDFVAGSPPAGRERAETTRLADLHSARLAAPWWRGLKGNNPTRLISVFQKRHCVPDRAEEERVMDGHLCLPVVKGINPHEW